MLANDRYSIEIADKNFIIVLSSDDSRDILYDRDAINFTSYLKGYTFPFEFMYDFLKTKVDTLRSKKIVMYELIDGKKKAEPYVLRDLK